MPSVLMHTEYTLRIVDFNVMLGMLIIDPLYFGDTKASSVLMHSFLVVTIARLLW